MPNDDNLPMVIGAYKITRKDDEFIVLAQGDDSVVFSAEYAFHVGMALASFAAVVNGCKPFPARDYSKDFPS